MRVEVPGRDIRPGDMIWFSNDRKPSVVKDALVQDGAERLVVLHSDNGKIWYMQHETGTVQKYIPDPPAEEEEEAPVFLDPDGNPT